jgi:hypothetical protein
VLGRLFAYGDSRRAAVDEIFTGDCMFYEPKGVYAWPRRDATSLVMEASTAAACAVRFSRQAVRLPRVRGASALSECG